MLAVDHVIVVVHDLDAAARRYDKQLGLGSVAGGRHAEHGTGNRIVPLGDSYIELMAVVDRDEAASSSLGSWVERRLGEAPVALCLRTDDIEAAAESTGSISAATGIASRHGWGPISWTYATSKALLARAGSPSPPPTATPS